ncbi:MAG TPA: protein kinase [Chthoniobacterales bacterium]|nr:protein kinase [Chthoniobacterales bacterium]
MSTTIVRTCRKCGAKLFGSERVCSACLLETALGPIGDDDTDDANDEQSGAPSPMMEFGDYELLEEIGRGGQGVVYRARQKSLNRIVALKVIALGHFASTPHLKRFRHEAESAAKLEHPQIVPIYEIAERDGSCYFSMKFIEGGRLDELVETGPMPPRLAAELLVKIARTVQFAHEHGILHRDIKPGNVLLDKKGEPHLTDFGLARLIEQESTITNSFDVLGTPSYMAPEQAAGRAKELTPGADVYSLGAVFYHLLTGEPPFAGGTTYETIRMVLETEPRNPRLRNSKVDVDLATICLKCLEKQPEKRYQTAAALVDDLERWLQDKPIQARPATVFKRTRKWVRRHRTSVALGLAAAAVGVMAAVMIWNAGWNQPLPSGIAVLPFENLSEDKENAYLVDGIQDEILTRLSKIADLKVISRTSTQNYKSRPENLRDIARQLGVAHILEGSVQKSGEAVRVNVQLIKAANDSHFWADTYDRRITDIFSVETDVARAIADQLRAKLTGQEDQVIADKPTGNAKAYDAYLRGLAYSQRPTYVPTNSLAAQKYFREALRLDPKFALGWALLAYVDAREYITRNLETTLALREETRRAAETALTLQPNLGEAVLAKGYYHYACQKDYKTAERYYEQARQLLPNSSRIPELLAYAARRQGRWDQAESYFNEAERLDPRDVYLLTQHAQTHILRRRFPEALQKLEQVLNITPDDPDTLALMAAIAQAEGDLPRASTLLAPIRLAVNDPSVLKTQVYQAILERRPAPVIATLKEILVKPDPALGYYNGELRFWLGWAQEMSGDHAGAKETWQQVRRELESFVASQPENNSPIEGLALTNIFLGNKAEALSWAERGIAAVPIEKDAMTGPRELEILARVAAQAGEPDRAIAALQKLLSIPYSGALVESVPLTPQLLRLDPMFDPLRGDARFEKIVVSLAPKSAKP